MIFETCGMNWKQKYLWIQEKWGICFLIIRCIYEKPQRTQRKATTFCVLVCKN